VGRGEADTADEALALARDRASDALLSLASRELRLPFDDERLPDDGTGLDEALGHWRQASAGLTFTRAQDAARRVEGGYEVIAQYAIPRAELDALADRYGREATFRGLTVAPRAPWAAPGIRLVRRESYIRNVEPGDLLRAVGSTAITSIDEFEGTAAAAYQDLEEGGTLQFVFDRAGEPVITSIYKPKTRAEPVPVPTNRPTLFRRD
ncbi:MAG: hypothetical protein ABMB14_39880, partial [Myxococcota bacterium]